MDQQLTNSLAKLHAVLHQLSQKTGPLPLAIAFSGGLDSRFLAYTAHNLGLAIQLYHFQGPQIGSSETKTAQAWAKQQQIPLICIDANPLHLQAVQTNQPDRCYHCKKFLFSHLQTLLAPLNSLKALDTLDSEEGNFTTTVANAISSGTTKATTDASTIDSSPTKATTDSSPTKATTDASAKHANLICDGTNFSDLGQYRPGLQALRELKIQSPLALAQIGKADIHALAQATHLDNPQQLPRPCLLTRFPYNSSITVEALNNIQQLEDLVAKAVAICYPDQSQHIDFRVRQDPELFVHMVLPSAPDHLEAATKLSQILQKHNLPLRLTSNLSGYFDAKL